MAVYTRSQYETFWHHMLPKARQTGRDELRSPCLVHGGDNPESLLVHLDTGFAHCFKCDRDFSMLDWLMALGSSAEEAHEELRLILGTTTTGDSGTWQFRFPQPRGITDDPFRLRTLAEMIVLHQSKLNSDPASETEENSRAWEPWELYLYPTVKRVKLRFRNSVTGKKAIRWLALTDKGGWSTPSKVSSEPAPPYMVGRLAGVETIWIANGEKAVDRIFDAWPQVTATCLPNGEAKWDPTYLKYFKDARTAYVFVDNDPVGAEHGRMVGAELAKSGIETRIVALPGLAEKADLYDWIEAGHPYEETLAAALAAPLADPNYVRPRKPREKASENGHLPPAEIGETLEGPNLLDGYGFTDNDNAARLVAFSNGSLRYVRNAEQPWFSFDGCIWRKGEVEDVYPYANKAMLLLHQQARLQLDSERAKKVIRYAEKKRDANGVHAMIDLARSRLKSDFRHFDARPLLINCANGTYDLETGKLFAHSASDELTACFPFPFDPAAGPPLLWRRSLWEWMGGIDDPDASVAELERIDRMVEYVSRFIGYLMTGLVREKAFFVCYGTGNNGKTTFLSILQRILGTYAITINPSSLTRGFGRNENTVNADIARTRGMRTVFAGEPPAGQKFDQSLIKMLTQGEVEITGTFKGKQPFNFLPTAKVVLETNFVPQFDTEDAAFLNRMHLVRFGATFESKEDRRTALLGELPQIFTECVLAARGYIEHGLHRPEEMRRNLREVRAEQAEDDGLSHFLEMYFERDDAKATSVALIVTLYEQYAERFRKRPIQGNQMSRRLTERDGIRRVEQAGKRRGPAYLRGLTPKPQYAALVGAPGSSITGRDAQYKDAAELED